METTGGLGKEIRGLVIGKLGICVCWHPVWWLDFCGMLVNGARFCGKAGNSGCSPDLRHGGQLAAVSCSGRL